MASLKEYLSGQKLLDQIPLPTAIDVLLSGLQIVESTATDKGNVVAGVGLKPLLLDFALKPGGPQIPYAVTRPVGGFSLVIDLTDALLASKALALLDAGAAAVLRPGVVKTDPAAKTGTDGKPLAAEEWVEDTPDATDAVRITGLGFAIVVEGTNGAAATLRYSPSPGQPEGVLKLSLDPPVVMLGDTGFGLKLGDGMVLDLSKTAVPGVPAVIDGQPLAMPSEGSPAWKGLAIHKARLYLPGSVPLFGRTGCDVALDIGIAPVGIQLALTAHAPERDDIPAMDLRIECIDPAATGLSSFAPTLVEATVTLPIDKQKADQNGGTVTFLAGPPVIARARFSRDPTDVAKLTRLSITLESQGPNGIAMVKPTGPGDTLGIATVGAAGLATALIADNKLAGEGSSKHGGTMAALMTAGMVLTAILSDKGKLVVNRIELASAGHGLPVGQPLVFSVDYSVDVPIKPLNVGLLSISLDPERLLRIRMRGVTLTYDPAKSGLDRIALDFEHAVMDVEDAGNWKVEGSGSLFDVLGTRSGKGSVWLEVDLRFKLDLGPIKVSGATIRASLDSGGNIAVSLRGLDAGLSIPALVKAEGKVALIAPGQPGGPGFSASLDARILPLGIGADASITVSPPMVLVKLGVDLPGPLPLGPTGFGLFGLGGVLGIAAAITIPPDADGPIAAQLKWKPETGFAKAPGQFSFGALASVGTLPDLGFNFSAKAGLFLTVPDLAVLGSLDARFLYGPVSMADSGGPANNSVRGTISLLPKSGVSFALQGTFGVPHLVSATIPVAGAFPPDSDAWYVYVGSDGVEDGKGRGIGPVRMTVLPDLFGLQAQAYLMLRGNGIDKWRGGVTVPSGFVIAFGFGMEMTFGPKPGIWAEVNGGVDVLVATGPLVIAGIGQIDGSLHIGPISLGVSAKITVSMTDNSTYVMAEVCGRIHLLFVTLHKCAQLSFGGVVTPTIPTPVQSPIDLVAQDASGARIVTGQDANLLDDRYRKLAKLSTSPDDAPIVWPDALIRIGFAWAPAIDPTALTQFKVGNPEGPAAQPIGSDFLRYDWTLRNVTISDADSGVALAGPFSASWQAGKSGDTSKVAQPAELVLLTPQGDLWIDRMAEPSKTNPAGPTGALATACQVKVAAKVGWTLATGILKIMQPTRLPPEFIAADPTQSRVSGAMAWAADGLDGKPLALEALLGALPPGMSLVPPVPIPVSDSYAGRPFTGILTLPFFKRIAPLTAANPPALPAWFNATVLLDDYLVADDTPADPAGLYGAVVAMWLDARTAADYARMRPLRVLDETGEWTPEFAQLPSGQLRIVFRMPANRKAGRVTLRWLSDYHFALLGIGGVTATARAAARAKQKALDDQAAKNAATKAKAPAGSTGANDPDLRSLLQPGRRYCVAVSLDWKGTLKSQDDSGQPKVIGTKTGTWPVQKFYFATAPDPFAPGGTMKAVSPPTIGAADELKDLNGKQNAFAPEMLVRHLAGYEPGQSVVDRFRNDPLRAHFRVGHVERLAKLYGYALGLGLRRTDIAGDEGKLVLPQFKLVAPTSGKFLKGAAKAHWDLAATSACAVPVEGGTMDAPVQLAPRAWYELFVRATHAKAPDAALPGVTFRTSRWMDATDMLASLAFPTTGMGERSGDIALPGSIPPLASGTSDTAYDAALAALGLDGWPVPLEPRASVLWRRQVTDGRWAVAGLLLESPEPIERPDRVVGVTLGTRLAPTQSPVAFGTRVADRTGSRLLWLADAPFVPITWFVGPPNPATQRQPMLQLTVTDRPLDKSAATLTGLLRLPSAPLFAGEAS